jgi:hypothetical protein
MANELIVAAGVHVADPSGIHDATLRRGEKGEFGAITEI